MLTVELSLEKITVFEWISLLIQCIVVFGFSVSLGATHDSPDLELIKPAWTCIAVLIATRFLVGIVGVFGFITGREFFQRFWMGAEFSAIVAIYILEFVMVHIGHGQGFNFFPEIVYAFVILTSMGWLFVSSSIILMSMELSPNIPAPTTPVYSIYFKYSTIIAAIFTVVQIICYALVAQGDFETGCGLTITANVICFLSLAFVLYANHVGVPLERNKVAMVFIGFSIMALFFVVLGRLMTPNLVGEDGHHLLRWGLAMLDISRYLGASTLMLVWIYQAMGQGVPVDGDTSGVSENTDLI